jgi:dihydroneopterin triphosphate diphosphatase
MRQPYQILAFPFVKEKDNYYYAIFKRKDLKVWQGIAGGGEKDEKPIETTKREIYEEVFVDKILRYIRLASVFTIPAEKICGLKWGKKIIMIPEFAFGVELSSRRLKIYSEHTQYLWLSYKSAINKLKWDSNKLALWELNQRLKSKSLDDVEINIQTIRKFL